MAFFVLGSMQQVRIVIVGDFNFTYNTHHATNLALDHAGRFLEVEVSYYWLKIAEVLSMKPNQLAAFDGFWLAPGPYLNMFYLNGVIDHLILQKAPVFITGEGFKSFMDVLIQRTQLNAGGEKLISENLVEGNHFERLHIIPHSSAMIQLYATRSNEELTATRYSMYPQLIDALVNTELDIEAYNQFEEPEIVSMKNKGFFVAFGFCPQITSTRDLPHPLVYTFIKACMIDSVE